ncbi:hypothetical protein [Xanthobacter agilis]|uniref:Phasin domain-containing protein n=1 Tax=Xanthobacter agilis TaxID=47492 RepID=A0ABU0LIN2_XANAG|nr:hypothetical protein [Xanthobacter agilis]MDQ0506994.1 hypothetical protein [Xanthobacter agilis]
MSDFTIFPGLNRNWNLGASPMVDPTSAWKSYFFECPVAVASHLQRFMMRQAQDQMQVFAELARDPNPTAAVSRQAAFLQQSALAWNTEVMELAELMQSKLLATPASTTTQQDKAPLARAA